jgi:glucosamine kinase
VSEATLAVDAGQTEIRAALTPRGRGPRFATAPGVERIRAGVVGADEVAGALLAAIAGLGPLPLPAPPTGVGLSGFEAATEEDLDRVGQLLLERLGPVRLALASDGLTSLLGALGERDGAVVAAGTGTVCVARRGERLVKVDGWGSLLGDAGSGFAIGQAGLHAALRFADGRGGSEALLRAAERRYAPLPALPERIYGAPVPTRAVAAFAEDVAAEAALGDADAMGILDAAAAELALTACTALGRLFEAGEPSAVSYAGNVFRAGAPIVEPFARAVQERLPEAELVAPAGDALAGAALLASMEHPPAPAPGILWRRT